MNLKSNVFFISLFLVALLTAFTISGFRSS